jgi:roadblock/LC7 domain-containing protein
VNNKLIAGAGSTHWRNYLAMATLSQPQALSATETELIAYTRVGLPPEHTITLPSLPADFVKKYTKEFCWHWAHQVGTAQDGVSPWPIKHNGDTTRLTLDEKTGAFRGMQANLPYDCMGDATGVYAGEQVGAVGAGFINYAECSKAAAGSFTKRDDGKMCYSQGDANWKSANAMAPWNTATEVCDSNYQVLSSSAQGLTGNSWIQSNDFEWAVLMAGNPGVITNLQTARALRKSIIASHSAAMDNASFGQACLDKINACHGQDTCDFGSCVPQELQFSCVPKSDYLASSANSTNGLRVLTMFGSKRVSKASLPPLVLWSTHMLQWSELMPRRTDILVWDLCMAALRFHSVPQLS